LKLLGVLLESHVPLLLLLDAFLVCLEHLKQILDFFNLCFGIRVDNLSEVLHEAEISSHGVGQASQLAQLWDERHLVTSLAIFVDKQRLIGISDVFIVASLVVLSVASWCTILIESSFWTLSKVNSVDLVRLLVVLCHDGSAR